MSLDIALHSFFSSYFAFSAAEAVLYPAIRNMPFPRENTMPSITNEAAMMM